LVALMLGGAQRLVAQRTDFVFHVHVDPLYMTAHSSFATWVPFQSTFTWVRDPHLNPPGSHLGLGSNNQYALASAQFGPINGACGTPFSTGVWGLNDSCPDVLPPIGLTLAARVNCEIPLSRSLVPANTNLQTFLVIMNDAPSAGFGGGSTSMSIPGPMGINLGLASQLNFPFFLGSEVEVEQFSAWVRSISGGQR